MKLTDEKIAQIAWDMMASDARPFPGVDCSDWLHVRFARAILKAAVVEELEEKAALYDAVQEAAGSLVGGYSIELKVERHAGWVELFDEDGYSEDFPSNNESLADSIRDALGEAIRRTNEQK